MSQLKYEYMALQKLQQLNSNKRSRMIPQLIETILSPDNYAISISGFSFQQRFFKWQSYIKILKETNSEYLQISLEKVVEYYPFNFSFWNDLIQIILKMPKGKANTLKIYQVALAKNPRCVTLWRKFIDWLYKELLKSDPNYLRNQLENASRIIGNHYKAAFVFQYYLEIQKNPEKQYHMLKKAIVSPLEDIDKIKDIYLELIDSAQFMPYTLSIAESEGLAIDQNNLPIVQYCRILQEQLKQRILKLYGPTKQHVKQRETFQSKILADQYIPYSDSIQNWRKYIAFIKNSGNPQFLPSIYERALISHCDNQSLWEEYFLMLQNQGNPQRSLYLFRFHSTFFRNMSKELIYYWLQIQERDNPSHARELYLEMEISEYDLEIFMRHVQMQLRAKDFSNVKTIYQAILTIFTSNLAIVAHTIIQYAEFSVKYFRDIVFAKKLLQNYFSSYPFNEYLFISLLQFYEKNLEYKQGTKETKQIADQFIDYILIGLKKAYICVQFNEYKRIKKTANHHLRTYIMSIYLIKGAQRKLKQQEFTLKKQATIQGKRLLPEESKDEAQIFGRKR